MLVQSRQGDEVSPNCKRIKRRGEIFVCFRGVAHSPRGALKILKIPCGLVYRAAKRGAPKSRKSSVLVFFAKKNLCFDEPVLSRVVNQGGKWKMENNIPSQVSGRLR